MAVSEESEIICEDVVVEFPLFDSVARSVKARMTGNTGLSKRFRALDHVNVTVKKGERIGLLGKNGAGKSTFLRTLAGVYQPQQGSVTVNSEKVTSFFELSVGTDNDASGYENIPLLMATRGIPLSRLEEVTADVEEFSELGEALFRPVRTYSAGMRLRIAFAVATFHSEGVILMDEVVGVGDAQFRKKSQERINNALKGDLTLVLATHAQTLLNEHCNRALIFQDGRIEFDGSVEDAVKQI